MFTEGCVYKICYVVVVDNNGPFKATKHCFRLIFNDRTIVCPAYSEKIPFFGVSLTAFDRLCEVFSEDKCLVDVIGMVTSLKNENEFRKRSYKVDLIVFYLFSNIGKVECALFGDCGFELKSYFVASGTAPVVVVIQFAKLKYFRGMISLQNSRNCSRVLINPDICEARNFRNEFVDHILCSTRTTICGDNDSWFEDAVKDQLHLTQSLVTVKDLFSLPKKGSYVVVGMIQGIIKEFGWWYLSCNCSNRVVLDDGYFYCSACGLHVFDVTPRYKIKVSVSDRSGHAMFILCDGVVQRLVDKSCADTLFENPRHLTGVVFPQILNGLLGEKICFAVESKNDLPLSNGIHVVKSLFLGNDSDPLFGDSQENCTPQKMVLHPQFTDVFPHNDRSPVSSMAVLKTNLKPLATRCLNIPWQKVDACEAMQDNSKGDKDTASVFKKCKRKLVYPSEVCSSSNVDSVSGIYK